MFERVALRAASTIGSPRIGVFGKSLVLRTAQVQIDLCAQRFVPYNDKFFCLSRGEVELEVEAGFPLTRKTLRCTERVDLLEVGKKMPLAVGVEITLLKVMMKEVSFSKR